MGAPSGVLAQCGLHRSHSRIPQRSRGLRVAVGVDADRGSSGATGGRHPGRGPGRVVGAQAEDAGLVRGAEYGGVDRGIGGARHRQPGVLQVTWLVGPPAPLDLAALGEVLQRRHGRGRDEGDPGVGRHQRADAAKGHRAPAHHHDSTALQTQTQRQQWFGVGWPQGQASSCPVRDTSRVERGNLTQDAGRGLDEWHSQRSSRTLAQAHPQVHQRRQVEVGKCRAGARLDRAMAGHPVVRGIRGDGPGHQRGGAGDDPIKDDRRAQRGGGQQIAHDARVLEAADTGQGREGVSGARLVDPDSGLDNGILCLSIASSMPVPRPVTSATSRPVKTLVRAADAVVLAMPMSPVTSSRLPCATRSLATPMPTSTAACAWAAVIAGPMRHVSGARGDLARHQARGRWQVARDTHVDHDDLRAHLPAERVDHRSARQEAADHLGRDLLRPRRHPLRMDAVVSREYRDGDRLGRRRWALRIHPAKAGPEVFEGAHGAAWFGEHRLALPGGCHRFG